MVIPKEVWERLKYTRLMQPLSSRIFYDSLLQFSILYQILFSFLNPGIIFNSEKIKFIFEKQNSFSIISIFVFDFPFHFVDSFRTAILLFTHGLAACYNNITERGKVIVSIPIFFLLLEISNINYLTAESNRCYNTVVRPKERKAIWLL